MAFIYKFPKDLIPGDVVEFGPNDVDILVDNIEYPDGIWLEWSSGASGYVRNPRGEYKVIR